MCTFPSERPDVLLLASLAALLHRESVPQLRVLAATPPAGLQRPGKRFRHHQKRYAQMCKSDTIVFHKLDVMIVEAAGGGSNLVLICAALQLWRRNPESNRYSPLQV